MKISYNWLKKYIDLNGIDPIKIKEKLVLSTCEVEHIEFINDHFNKVIAVKILEIKKHPNADKLCLPKVFDGKEEYEIVCGATNIKPNQIVPFAKVGVTLPNNNRIEKSKIRGIYSNGMLCSGKELELNNDHEGIYILPENTPIGISLSEIFKNEDLVDVIYEIDNKSLTNRPDLWGHYGFARELAVLFDRELKPLQIDQKNLDFKDKTSNLKINTIDKKACVRYSGIIITNIKIEPSPKWMQNFLNRCGFRPINNIVDVTNFVMHELGQPLHAFDRKKIIDDEIIVRFGKENEYITTLDEQERKVDETILLIADKNKPIAIAGIIGGKFSEIDENTTDVVFESANFEPSIIRKGANKLGIRTDASNRFEKGQDPFNTTLALFRVIEILKEILPQAIIDSSLSDVFNLDYKTPEINLSYKQVIKKLGISLSKEKIVEILNKLQFKIVENNDTFIVSVPTFRATKDITCYDDLIEEIGRIYCYDNIKPSAPFYKVEPPVIINEQRRFERFTKNFLANNYDFVEVFNYSFLNKELLSKISIDPETALKLQNPLSEEFDRLRTSLLPNFLKNINLNQRNFDYFKIFELGRIYIKENLNNKELAKENKRIIGAIYKKGTDGINEFNEILNMVRYYFEKIKLPNFSFENVSKEKLEIYHHPGRTAFLYNNKFLLGQIYELHPKIQEKFEINSRVVIFELDVDIINKQKKKDIEFNQIPKYPIVPFDINVVCDKFTKIKDVEKILVQNIKKNLFSIELIEIYVGPQLGEDKKSLIFRIIFYDTQKTLSTDEITNLEKSIIENLKKNNLTIR